MRGAPACPRFVKIWMTPLFALEPYSAAAAAPLTTSMVNELVRAIVDDNPIDDIKGLSSRRDGGRAAQAYRDAAPGGAGILLDLSPCNFSNEGCVDRRCIRFSDPATGNRCDRVAKAFLLRRRSRSGHNHLLYLKKVLLQANPSHFHNRLLAQTHVDNFGFVSDE